MGMDAAELRSMLVKMHGIRGADSKFQFFYDETNNIRRFVLTDDGTNVNEPKNFVLGGVVLREGQVLPDMAPLRKRLGVMDNAPEIKFKHVASGDFEKVLTSRKLADFLSWVTDHQLAIHFSSINIVYWSIVDIIDSILANERFELYCMAQREMKNELYRIVCIDRAGFFGLLKHYGYPDLQAGQAGEFLAQVEAFINLHDSDVSSMPQQMLRELVRKAQRVSGLPFIQDGDADVLIDGFDSFFTQPILLFNKSNHVFDTETEVEKRLNNAAFRRRADGIDYRFSDSKADPGIQLADVIVGLLGKYQDFVEQHPLRELQARGAAWNEGQKKAFGLLRGLIDRSDDVSNAFIHRVTALDSERKNATFMHGEPAPYRLR